MKPLIYKPKVLKEDANLDSFKLKGGNQMNSHLWAMILLSFASITLLAPQANAQWTDNGETTHTSDRVGIGISNANEKLEIQDGNIRLFMRNAAGRRGHKIEWYESHSSNDIMQMIYVGQNLASPARGLDRLVFASGGWDWNQISDNNANQPHTNIIMSLQPGSNEVGIGTLNPSFKLDVAGTVNATEYRLNGQPVSFGGGGSLWTENSGNIYYNTGNVGIGIAVPTEQLDVVGNVKATSFIGDGSQLTGIDALQINNLPWTQFGPSIFRTGNVGIGIAVPTEPLDVAGNVKATSFIGDGSQLTGIDASQISNLPSGGTSLWTDNSGDISYSAGNVGIGILDPTTSLHTSGTIIAGGRSSSVFNNTSTTALNGGEGIILPGPNSQYLMSVQDGNGRVQHKWNATYGTGEKFLVGAEDAFLIDYTTQVNGSDPWIEFKHADGTGKAAGDAITWATHFSLDQSGNAEIAGDLNVNGTIDASNVLINGSPISGGSLTVIDAGERDLSVEAPSTRLYRPNLAAANTGAAFRVLSNPASEQPIFQVRSSGQATRFFVEHDGYTGGENSAYFSGNSARPHLFGQRMVIGSTSASDLTSGSILSVKGALDAASFIGDGSQLTGIDASQISNLPSGGTSLWTDNSGDISYSAGNVGIGTTTPNEKLEINGNMTLHRRSAGNSSSFLNMTSQNAGSSHLQFVSYNPSTQVFSNSFSLVNTATVRLDIQHPAHGTMTRFSNDGNIYFTPSDEVRVTGNLNVVGNTEAETVTANVFVGDGSQLTGIDASQISNLPSGGTSLWTDNSGDISYSAGNVGIGILDPTTSLHTSGTIIAGGRSSSIFNNTSTTALNGGEGIILPGPTSQYLMSVQDGNGRVQHKWNATYGTNEKFLVGEEDAFFIDYTTIVNGNDPWIEFKHADGAGKAAGDAITWATHFSLDQSGNAAIAGNLNVNGTIDASNILINGSPISGGSLTLIDAGERDISVEVPSTRPYRPNLTAANTGVALRVLTNPGIQQPIFQIRSSGQATRFFVEHDGYTGGENSAYFSGNSARPHLFGQRMVIGSTNASDLTSGSILSVKGNLDATAFIGDGSQLTGIDASQISNLPTGGSSVWTQSGNDISYNAGNVSIGTGQFTMNGDIVAKRIAVSPTPDSFTEWPDYVFEKDYELLTIEELEHYIIEEKHLPEVPSASEVAEEGIDLGKMDATLLKKVEELTLYIIDQNKQLIKQNKRIEQLEARLADQK